MGAPYRNPGFFIVGCARSGTTLLQRIVGAHPEAAVLHELHWVGAHLKKRKVKKPRDPVTPETALELLDNHRFVRLKIAPDEFTGLFRSGNPMPYAEFLTAIFDLYGEVEGKPIVGNKTPAYVRNIPGLHEFWPHAKFIHIIRDGRDVCLSVMGWSRAEATTGGYATWAEDPVSTVALWWKRKVLLGREGGISVGPELYREVSYESLIARPKSETARLCSFLGLFYDEAMLKFDAGRRKIDPVDPDHPWMPITSGMRDWRSEMSAESVERFEALAGDLLAELGYPRAFPHPGEQATEHAARMRLLFTEDIRSRGKKLPTGWPTT